MNSEQYPSFLSSILESSILNSLSQFQCEWNTSFCKSCGCDLVGYNSYCQTCKRELKINQIINDTKTRS